MRKLTVILSILMLVCAIMPQAAAFNDSLEVIVTVEKGAKQPGSELHITAHVFDLGSYVTADEISVEVGPYPSTEVNLTETQTGIYTGSYTIKPEDMTLTIMATAEKGTDSEMSYTVVDLEEEVEDVVDFEVDVSLDDQEDYQAEPGDAVEITVTVKENGTLVDPDTFALYINENSLPYTEIGNGTYTATYNVPSALTKGGIYEIGAHAQKDDMEDFDGDSFYVLFFMICYHNITKTNTSSTFDIYVSDMNGDAVVGATVSFRYDHDDDDGTPRMSKQGTTDNEGKAEFTITHEDVSYIEVEGTVSHGGKSQEFDGTISVPGGIDFLPDGPSEDGFDVVDMEALKSYKSGTSVTKQYTAYMDGIPWANKSIYYCLVEGYSPAYDVIKQGSVDTDDNGRFSVSFNAPQELSFIYFETGRPKTGEDFFYDEDDDLVYEEDNEIIITSSGVDSLFTDWDDSVSVSVDTLMVGGPTKVRVSGSSIPADARVVAAWFVGDADEYLETMTGIAFRIDWECWTGMPGIILSKSDGEYVGEILLPEFMPQDEDYTVIAGWTTTDGDPHLNYVVLKPGESGGTGPGSDDDGVAGDTFILIGVLVIILIILLVVIKVATKPKKKGPM